MSPHTHVCSQICVFTFIPLLINPFLYFVGTISKSHHRKKLAELSCQKEVKSDLANLSWFLLWLQGRDMRMTPDVEEVHARPICMFLFRVFLWSHTRKNLTFINTKRNWTIVVDKEKLLCGLSDWWMCVFCPYQFIRCTVTGCSCVCFKAGSDQIRSCDRCGHGWVAHGRTHSVCWCFNSLPEMKIISGLSTKDLCSNSVSSQCR